MSRLISDILGAPEPKFSQTIRLWEEKSGRPGHDLRLISDVTANRKHVIKGLGLDENDTTGRELYHALRLKARQTNAEFEKLIGVEQNDSPDEILKKIIRFVEKLDTPLDNWSLKPATIKKILKKHPPKKLMKMLGLRSIDSVLKRASPGDFLVLGRITEPPDWSKKVSDQFKTLSSSDFDRRKITISLYDKTKAKKIQDSSKKSVNPINSNFIAGTIVVMPPQIRFTGDTLGIALLLLHHIDEVRSGGAFIRYISASADFGLKIQKLAENGQPGGFMAMQVGWRPLQKHLHANPDKAEKVEQPYLQHEHLENARPYDALDKHLPSHSLWSKSGTMFIEDDNLISLNLMDIIINDSNNNPYEKAVKPYLKIYIWEDLGSRYLNSPFIENETISHLEKWL